MTHGSRRKVVLEDDKMGEGPTLSKHRAVEKDRIVQASLIWAPRSWPPESFTWELGPPPLRLKVERQGGSDLIFTAVDPGAYI